MYLLQNSQKTHFIYLVREREFIRLDEQTYKLGKTKQDPNRRLYGYPKHSEVLLFACVRNCDLMENLLMKSFGAKFTQKKEYGREYFEGNREAMLFEIYTKCQEEITTTDHQRHQSKLPSTTQFKE